VVEGGALHGPVDGVPRPVHGDPDQVQVVPRHGADRGPVVPVVNMSLAWTASASSRDTAFACAPQPFGVALENHDGLADVPTLEARAAEFGAHSTQLMHAFGREYGLPPHRYVTGRRAA
jgi:hypothetical protein